MHMVLHKHGFLLGDAGGSAVEDMYGELLKAQVGVITESLDPTIEDVQRIRKDRRLNKIGKSDKISRMTMETMEKINNMTEHRRRGLLQDMRLAEDNPSSECPGETQSALSFFDYNVQRAKVILNKVSGFRLG